MVMNPNPSPTLFVVTSMLDDWLGNGPAVIQWAVWQRNGQALPWSLATIVADYVVLEPAAQDAVTRAVERYFTRHEAETLGVVLKRASPFRNAPVRFAMIELPLTADDALAMQALNPGGVSPTLWRVRLSEAVMPGHAVLIEGIISLWPWPGLAPSDIQPLMAMRERLGLDPVPPPRDVASDANWTSA